MPAYSIDLRQKIVLAYTDGEGTLDEMADIFGVGRRTVARPRQLYRTAGTLCPKPHGGGYPARLDASGLELSRHRVRHSPDATLQELSDFLQAQAQVDARPATTCRALRRLGLRRKKEPRGGGT